MGTSHPGVSPQLSSTQVVQLQQQQQQFQSTNAAQSSQQPQSFPSSNMKNGITQFNNSGSSFPMSPGRNSNNPNNHGSPESMPSPGGSISEESILKSWSISTLHDNIYLNPNLARDDPRNDLGTFMYLPSEFEYGDAPALSPAASSVNGGGSNSAGNGGTGSDGGMSPRPL
ncbi:hypothetical protein BG011_007271 [Mortierella polycephala]|uniref:Uncharacterized protein n=1 Tax=Mortierella polycephala TaxID=41804 RepID=A0A9P6TXY5_9FUNG|nr:hypothetical protein BG011_007271 [Mortierella polycephala]